MSSRAILVILTVAPTCAYYRGGLSTLFTPFSYAFVFYLFHAVRRTEPFQPGSTEDTAGASACAAPDAHEQAHAPLLGPEAMAAAHARVTSKADQLRLKRDLIQHVWDARPDA